MSNTPKNHITRAHASNIDVAKMMSEPERIMHNPAKPSFHATFNRQRQRVQEQTSTYDDALRSENKTLLSIQEQSTTSAPDSLSQFLNRTQLHMQIREIA